MINQTITTALTNLGITVFSPDFVNGLLDACNLVSDEVSFDHPIDRGLNIGGNLAILLTDSFEATFEESGEFGLNWQIGH